MKKNTFGGAKVRGSDGVKFKTKNHYGIRSDFGYDLTETVSPYITLGYAQMNYGNRSSSLNISNETVLRDH